MRGGGGVRIALDDEETFQVDAEHLDAVMARLSTLGLRSLVCTPPSLEQLFLQHYGDQPAVAEIGAR